MVEMSRTYAVRAQRDGKWWVITAAGVPGAVAQARRLDQAPDEIRTAIAMVLGVPDDQVAVELEVELPGAELTRLRDARAAQLRDAELLRDEAARTSRLFVAQLHALGMTVRDIGVVMGTSAQRAQQILAETRTAR